MVALYVLLAITTRFVLIGILPILMSVRAIKAKETLAPRGRSSRRRLSRVRSTSVATHRLAAWQPHSRS